MTNLVRWVTIATPNNLYFWAEKLSDYRINNQIRSPEVRVIDGVSGENLGVMPTREALNIASEKGFDLIEISPNAVPPIAKIMDYGKFQYEQNKKEKTAKAGSHKTETKSIQIKIGTGENDLALKARKASEWLSEGHRVKVELYLVGRAKFADNTFKKERLERILGLISTGFKISEPLKPSPRGVAVTLEKDATKKKEKDENK